MTDVEKESMKQNAEFAISLAESLARLQKNDDFNKLISFYINTEPVRLTHLIADPSITMADRAEMHRQEIRETLIGISRFAMFLRNVYSLADMGRKTLEDLKNESTESTTEVE